MKKRIVITDLTRFKAGNDDVCIAGIEINTGECIRPMPYITQDICKKHNLLPGSYLEGDFEKYEKLSAPHYEDYKYSQLSSDGHCSSEEFEQILIKSLSKSIEEGFGVNFAEKQKSIPNSQAEEIKASIITIQVPKKRLRVIEDAYDKTKVKIHFYDSSVKEFSFMPITDNGYYYFIKDKQAEVPTALADVNQFIQSQDKVYLRVGLGRVWKEAFWLQVNGIYTFPEYHSDIRSYK